MPDHDLEAVMRGIGKAIREAQHAIALHSVETFQSHFEREGDEVRPRTVALPVPAGDGRYSTKPVPTAALAHHDALQLEEVRLKMRVLLHQGEDGRPRVQVRPVRPRIADEGDADAEEYAELELRFKRADPPEGVARVSTEYHKQL